MSASQKKFIGEELRRLRLERNLTLEQLAYLSGLTYQTVFRLETMRKGRKYNPELNTLNSIARALGKDLKVEFVKRK